MVTMDFTHADIARVCHEANRAIQHITLDPHPSPPWDDAPEWQRQSAVEGVAAALAGATPAEHHQAWVEAKVADGWTYGPVKDADAKTHPCLLPYDELPDNQRVKDTVFLGIVAALTTPHERNDEPDTPERRYLHAALSGDVRTDMAMLVVRAIRPILQPYPGPWPPTAQSALSWHLHTLGHRPPVEVFDTLNRLAAEVDDYEQRSTPGRDDP